MIIVIPAYKPDEKLITLIENLKKITDADIITVDDGGKAPFVPIFEKCTALGAKVLTHPENMGKGAALKTAFRYIYENYGESECIVTADADGQHLPEDIVNCLSEAAKNPGTLIVGGRDFKGDVPLRSRFGNFLSRITFKLLMGEKIYDTQTGLRAFSYSLIPDLLDIKGDRYEYEMQMLCDFVKKKIPVKEIKIKTVYIEENKSSHFSPLRDAKKVYSIMIKSTNSVFFQIIGFLCSSLFATFIDVLVLAVMQFILSFKIENTYTISFLVARITSSVVNFKINKKIFHSSRNPKKSFILFALLVVFIGICNYSIAQLIFINHDIMPDILAHICAMTICFPMSYCIQKFLIFPKKKHENRK